MSRTSTEDPAARLAEWRAAHPTATLAEIEQAVDRALRAYRAALIMETAEPVGPRERPVCPECRTPLQQVGQRARTLRTAHEGRLRWREPTWRCPSCGAGVFPPE